MGTEYQREIAALNVAMPDPNVANSVADKLLDGIPASIAAVTTAVPTAAAIAALINIPKNGVAFTVVFPIYKTDGTLITGATGLDSEISKNLGTAADCTNEATEIATTSGTYYLTLTATEMTATQIMIHVHTTSTGAIIPTIAIYPK